MNKRNIISCILITIVCCTLILRQPVQAVEAYDYVKYSNSMTLALNSCSGYYLLASEILKDSKITKCASSKKTIATISAFSYGKNDNGVHIKAVKPGKATLTITAKNGKKEKKVKIDVVVEKYKTPFKSLKYGSQKVKIYDTSEGRNGVINDSNKKESLSIVLKPGWKILKYFTWTEDDKVINCKTTDKLDFKKHYSYRLTLYNKTKGQTLQYSFILNWEEDEDDED